MKICINGVTRDMTPEEEERYFPANPELTIEDKAEAYDILIGGAE